MGVQASPTTDMKIIIILILVVGVLFLLKERSSMQRSLEEAQLQLEEVTMKLEKTEAELEARKRNIGGNRTPTALDGPSTSLQMNTLGNQDE